MIYDVIRKSDNTRVYSYESDSVIEWQGMELDTHFHNPREIVEQPLDTSLPQDWYINVGSFYDRFGAYKLPILASEDAFVQAIIKDTAVRKYIDLKGRRSELEQALMLLQSKGFLVDSEAILNNKPTETERYGS